MVSHSSVPCSATFTLFSVKVALKGISSGSTDRKQARGPFLVDKCYEFDPKGLLQLEPFLLDCLSSVVAELYVCMDRIWLSTYSELIPINLSCLHGITDVCHCLHVIFEGKYSVAWIRTLPECA